LRDLPAERIHADMTWDPQQYLAFADHRLRPAVDLLNRVALDQPADIVDLGCGAGNVTRLLKKRWPDAAVTGVDSSANMLARARSEAPGIDFRLGDLDGWQAERPTALIYSNAALHWLDHHEKVFPHLMRQLAPGGTLAVQMPRNHRAPSHVGMSESIAAGPWAERLGRVRSIRPVGDPADYYDLLAPFARHVEIWETEYLQVLDGADPVVEWTKGTALKPYLDALSDEERPAFLADYRARMARAYPPRADGRTLFPFRRIFIVASAR